MVRMEEYKMSMLFDDVELSPFEEEHVKTADSRAYLKLHKLHEELERKKESIFNGMSEEEREMVYAAIQQKPVKVPEYIKVADAARIIGVSPQMIRKYCSEGKLNAQQSMPGSGRWKIKASELMHYPGWNDFIERKKSTREKTKELAEFMNENNGSL